MKMTLLEVVQKILSSLNSDEVNSINDTTEALQVADIVETVYYEILSDRDWPHLRSTFKLDSSGDTAMPTHMRMPDTVQKLTLIKYDIRQDVADPVEYRDLIRLDPEDFLDFIMSRDASDTTVQTVTDFGGVDLLIRNDTSPTYWTSFDDEWLVFDSFDSNVDTTLQSSKTQCVGYIEPSWTRDDSFQIDLPGKNMQYLLAEAKSVAWTDINEQPNQKAEQQSRRQRIWSARTKWRENGGIKLPDYGRR